ncbi:MAG: hypothetical protein ACOX0F_06785 [Syntrophomonadaceae bacterium]|jgi:hypothetical protein
MLDLRYFNFCPLQQGSVLGLVCRECQYLTGTEGEHQCSYEVTEETNGHAIKDIIIRLLQCLEEGQLSISQADLLALLEE